MKKLIAKFSALTLVAGAIAVAGPVTAQGQVHKHQVHKHTAEGSVVRVLGSNDRVTLSRTRVAEGRITFKVASTNAKDGSDITLFRLARQGTLAKFRAGLVKVFQFDKPLVAASGTSDLKRVARYFGLAQVVKGTPATVTVRLRQGNYLLIDLAKGPASRVTSLKVLDTDRDRVGFRRFASNDRRAHKAHVHVPTVRLTSALRFDSPKVLPAKGTVRVKNVANTLHFMAMEPVKKGTTDAQVQKFLDSGVQAEPPFALRNAPGVGLDVLSPNKGAKFSYNLRPGTYVLMCFVPSERTGVPHAALGMHKVVTLK